MSKIDIPLWKKIVLGATDVAVAVTCGVPVAVRVAPIESGGLVPLNTFTFEKMPGVACPVECRDTPNGVAVNYLGQSATKGSWGEDLCVAQSYVAACSDIGN